VNFLPPVNASRTGAAVQAPSRSPQTGAEDYPNVSSFKLRCACR
jgi:hypothetical protein